jgi:hypothetical protein
MFFGAILAHKVALAMRTTSQPEQAHVREIDKTQHSAGAKLEWTPTKVKSIYLE